MGTCKRCGGRRDRETWCECPRIDQPATPPEPAAPACGCDGPVHECRATHLNEERLIAAFPLRTPAAPAPEPAAPDCTCATARFEDDPCPAHGAPEPDEAERTACNEASSFFFDLGIQARTSEVDALATLLRAAEARGRERGLEEAARECDQLAGIAERGPWPGRRHEYTSAAKRIRALRSGR